jgi:hypothetical protein
MVPVDVQYFAAQSLCSEALQHLASPIKPVGSSDSLHKHIEQIFSSDTVFFFVGFSAQKFSKVSPVDERGFEHRLGQVQNHLIHRKN